MVSTCTSSAAWFEKLVKLKEHAMLFVYLDDISVTIDARTWKIRLAIVTAIMAKFNKIWSSRNISLSTKISLYKALLTSTVFYGCDSWTLTADTTTRIQAFEKKFILHEHDRDIAEGPQAKRDCSRSNKGNDSATRETDRGREKKKARVVLPHQSPQ